MKTLSRIYTALIMVFLYAPMAVMIVFSFNSSRSTSVFGGFSTQWYGELLNDSSTIEALKNTLILAILSSLIATVLGTLSAVGIFQMKRKFVRTAIMTTTNIPMMNPDIVTGISLMLLFTFFRMTPGYITLIMAHITFCLPTVVLSVLPKLRQMNVNLYEAALDLGCNRRQAFFNAIMPEIMPGIVTGTLMALTYSIDDFIISYFTSGPESQTLPITIYSMTKKRISPEINALSTILFVIVFTILIVVNVIGAEKEKEEERKASAFSKK